MYILKDETKELLKQYKLYFIAKEIGINRCKISNMLKKSEPCMKLTAYALSKFLNNKSNIETYFIKK
jgi:hypothetical protein